MVVIDKRVLLRVIAPLLAITVVGTYGINQLSASQAAPLVSQPEIGVSETTLTISGDQRLASDPPASIRPSDEFRGACFLMQPRPNCNDLALAAITSARQRENLGALSLSPDYANLTAAEQIFAVTNAERVDRGLPAMDGPDARLNALALSGAQANDRPVGPSGYTWGSNWAGNVSNVLTAHYLWMYDDGPDSSNRSCTADNTTGCWGHRHNILSPWAGAIGIAETTVDGYPSIAQLFVKNWSAE